MKHGFEQTNDLVRFRVRNAAGVLASLFDIADHRTWLWQDAGHAEPYGSVISLVCPKSDAPKVLDILRRHGFERAEVS